MNQVLNGRTRMKTIFRATVIGLFCLGSVGCLNIEAPSDVQIGHSAPPPVVRSHAPKTYEDALDAWEQACQRNAWLEKENARLDRKYHDARKDKEKYKRRYKDLEHDYDKLKDRYDDD